MSEIARRVQYTGNGSAKAFPFGFRVFETTEVGVWLGAVRAASGYTVAIDEDEVGGGGLGGTVTFAAAPAAGVVVTLVAEVEPKRVSTFQQAGEFRAATINAELDRVVAVLGQLREAVARRLAPAETDVALLSPLPDTTTRAGRVLAFDASGQPQAPDAAAARALLGLAAGATGWTSLGISAYLQTLLDDPTAAAARATLGLAAGSAGWTSLGISAYAQALLDDPDAAAARATLGLAPGSAAWAALGISAFARTILDDADAAAALTTLGVSAYVRGLVAAADAAAARATLGLGSAAVLSPSAFAVTLLDDADADAARATLGLGSGALLSPSSYAQSLLDDPDAAAARATLGLAPGPSAWAALGISAFARQLLDDADATAARGTLELAAGATAWATLGIEPIVAAKIAEAVSGGNTVSPFMATVLDDADAPSARSTLGITPANLGISAFAQTLLDDTSASTALTTLGFSAFIKSLIDDGDAATARATLGLTAGETARVALGLGAAALLGVQNKGAGSLLREDGDGAWVSGTIGQADPPPSISNNASDPYNDIDVASKTCTADDTGRTTLFSTGAITKRLDALWAAGTGQGGRDAGSKTANTWYSVWVIATASRVQDVLFSTSATSPTMPATYIYKRRIGWIRTDASGNILPFRQEGDRFVWPAPRQDASTGTEVPTTASSLVVSAPPYVPAEIQTFIYHPSAIRYALITSPLDPDTAPAATVYSTRTTTNGSALGLANLTIKTGASSTIRWRSDNSGTSTGGLFTLGWIDTRGRDV